MLDPRPVFYVIGLFILCLGGTMAVPAIVEVVHGGKDWRVFVISGLISLFIGGALAGRAGRRKARGFRFSKVSFWSISPGWSCRFSVASPSCSAHRMPASWMRFSKP